MPKLTLLTILLCLLVSGCRSQLDPRQIELGDGISFDLLSPDSYGDTLALTQLAEVSYDNEVRELLFVIEIGAESIVVVGTMPNGTRLFSILYDGETIESDSWNPLLNSINPRYLLADLQLSRWPIDVVDRQLHLTSPCFGTGLCAIAETGDRSRRLLTRAGEAVVSIDYEPGSDPAEVLVFNQHERNYRLTFVTLEAGRIEQ